MGVAFNPNHTCMNMIVTSRPSWCRNTRRGLRGTSGGASTPQKDDLGVQHIPCELPVRLGSSGQTPCQVDEQGSLGRVVDCSRSSAPLHPVPPPLWERLDALNTSLLALSLQKVLLKLIQGEASVHQQAVQPIVQQDLWEAHRPCERTRRAVQLIRVAHSLTRWDALLANRTSHLDSPKKRTMRTARTPIKVHSSNLRAKSELGSSLMAPA